MFYGTEELRICPYLSDVLMISVKMPYIASLPSQTWSYAVYMVSPKKFRGTYRIQSARHQSWDYTGCGRYFVTVCTLRRAPYFGSMQNGIMHLSDIGKVVDREWKLTGEKRPPIALNENVIMPDHFHAIIIIHVHAIDMRDMSVQNPHHRPDWQSGYLGTVIQQFKRACSHHIHDAGHPHFRWLSNFHDHIIPDDAAFDRIRRYILDNPRHWNI